MLGAPNGISCPGCFLGAPVIHRAPSLMAGALGMSDGTRNAVAAGGLLLAAVGLGFVIWKSEHAAKPRRRRRRRFATSF